MTESEAHGIPARDLSDEELERQGTQAHETRNWVFLHGTAEQFATHTTRMLELEQEYLRRHPKRTWQGTGGAGDEHSEVEVLREALRNIMGQIEALLARPGAEPETEPQGDPAVALLRLVAQSPGGRLHKLEVHQAAREAGLSRAELAKLYTAVPPLLMTDQEYRLLTEAGGSYLASPVVGG